ncbi:hypothetical protein [Bradyrhizobium sp. AC87j1]|uniref:hypothetical protein n=1 Tax=Bradyrhizobium sp. AC87j1 TaxID=2055894 RepID=UPI0011AFE548|nr:hypothetical protein [Bradyrhizobium sp. AC87j1]
MTARRADARSLSAIASVRTAAKRASKKANFTPALKIRYSHLTREVDLEEYQSRVGRSRTMCVDHVVSRRD